MHLVLVMDFALAACSSSDPGASLPDPGPEQEDAYHTIPVGHVDRSYRLLVPDTVDEPAPVVIVFHGAGGSSKDMAGATQFDRVANQNGFAVAYPDAFEPERTWNVEFCCFSAPERGFDDVGFVDGLVDVLSDDDRIDMDRVYLVGISNGGALAYRYACLHADRIAGVASVAGAMLVEDCEPASAVSILEIHGTGDEIVPFEGGDMFPPDLATSPIPPIPVMVEFWADRSGCSEPVVIGDETVTTTTWSDCDEGATVELVAIEGAGHTWFGPKSSRPSESCPACGPLQGAVDATDFIVDYFDLAP